MNAKTRNIIKKIGIIFLVVCLVVMVSNFAVDRIFYNPEIGFKNASTAFSLLNQLLAPSMGESYLDEWQSGGVPEFSCHTQGFRLLEAFYSHTYDPAVSGQLIIDSVGFNKRFIRPLQS